MGLTHVRIDLNGECRIADELGTRGDAAADDNSFTKEIA